MTKAQRRAYKRAWNKLHPGYNNRWMRAKRQGTARPERWRRTILGVLVDVPKVQG